MEGISPFSMCLCGFFIPVLALCAYVVFLFLCGNKKLGIHRAIDMDHLAGNITAHLRT